MSKQNEQEERGRQALLALGKGNPAVELVLEVIAELEAAAAERTKNPQAHLMAGGDRAVSYACGGAAYLEMAREILENYLDPSLGPDDAKGLEQLRLARIGGGT